MEAEAKLIDLLRDGEIRLKVRENWGPRKSKETR